MVAWLVGIAAVFTLGVIGFAGCVMFIAVRDRRRRGRERRAGPIDAETDVGSNVDAFVEPAALDFVQIWLDNEWDQKFG
jgi:hypothetical protein